MSTNKSTNLSNSTNSNYFPSLFDNSLLSSSSNFLYHSVVPKELGSIVFKDISCNFLSADLNVEDYEIPIYFVIKHEDQGIQISSQKKLISGRAVWSDEIQFIADQRKKLFNFEVHKYSLYKTQDDLSDSSFGVNDLVGQGTINLADFLSRLQASDDSFGNNGTQNTILTNRSSTSSKTQYNLLNQSKEKNQSYLSSLNLLIPLMNNQVKVGEIQMLVQFKKQATRKVDLADKVDKKQGIFYKTNRDAIKQPLLDGIKNNFIRDLKTYDSETKLNCSNEMNLLGSSQKLFQQKKETHPSSHTIHDFMPNTLLSQKISEYQNVMINNKKSEIVDQMQQMADKSCSPRITPNLMSDDNYLIKRDIFSQSPSCNYTSPNLNLMMINSKLQTNKVPIQGDGINPRGLQTSKSYLNLVHSGQDILQLKGKQQEFRAGSPLLDIANQNFQMKDQTILLQKDVRTPSGFQNKQANNHNIISSPIHGQLFFQPQFVAERAKQPFQENIENISFHSKKGAPPQMNHTNSSNNIHPLQQQQQQTQINGIKLLGSGTASLSQSTNNHPLNSSYMNNNSNSSNNNQYQNLNNQYLSSSCNNFKNPQLMRSIPQRNIIQNRNNEYNISSFYQKRSSEEPIKQFF